MPIRRCVAWLLVGGVVVLGGALGTRLPEARGEEGPAVQVPTTTPPVLDGRLDDPAWTQAARLTAGTRAVVAAPRRPARDEIAPHEEQIQPEVRVAVAGGRLWWALEVAQDAGYGVGFHALALPAGASLSERVALGYAPQDPRLRPFLARGPRGVDRAAHRLEAAVDLTVPGRWSIEASIPLEDLGVTSSTAALSFALAVHLREPSLLAWAPPEAAFADPSDWARLAPPPEGWDLQVDDASDGPALATADRASVPALTAWRRYVAAQYRTIDDMLREASLPTVSQGEATPEAVDSALAQALLDPLEELRSLRPDLAAAHVARAEVLAVLGRFAEADAALDAAEGAIPRLREARYARAFLVRARQLLWGSTTGPTDYEGALASIAALRENGDSDAYREDAVDFATGMLHYLAGRFDEARDLLTPLPGRYPSQADLVRALERATAAADAWAAEQQYRRMAADDLPRVVLHTARGDITFELYLQDAPNTVLNLLWLAEHGFLDATAVSRATPFLGVVLGDPRTRADVPADRGPGPGYAIPTEPPSGPSRRRRQPFRGSLVMLGVGPQTEGSRFLVLTGTALRLGTDFTVFGRVAAGQEVVDRLEMGDAIERVEVLRRGAASAAPPRTAAGSEAPAPK